MMAAAAATTFSDATNVKARAVAVAMARVAGREPPVFEDDVHALHHGEGIAIGSPTAFALFAPTDSFTLKRVQPSEHAADLAASPSA